MRVLSRVATCLLILLYDASALLTDEECASYHELRTATDYSTFAEDCAGKEVLGFERGVSNKFYAHKMIQEDFNSLFENAIKVSFFIYIENTHFEKLNMPKIQELNGGLSIRNNRELKTFHINRAHQFARTSSSPSVVTVDGNPLLSEESMEDLRYLCNYCDIFKWTKCSALNPVKPSAYNDLVSTCAGERIIKQKPGSRFYLYANKLTMQQFMALFSEATHVELCLVFRDMQWKQILFPKLVRLTPCGYGDPSLEVIHNSYLTAIDLPAYDSEGFGRLNPLTNVELKNNFVLPPHVLQSLKRNCRFCKLQQYKECENLYTSSTENATDFVDNCGGKRIMSPKEGQILELDISTLSQDLVDELFLDVTYIKMCITLKNSQIKSLRMPNLKELHSCQPGRPAFLIEENNDLMQLVLSPEFAFDENEYQFAVLYNPRLPSDIYRLFDRCRGCVFETGTRCGKENGGYNTLEELLMYCNRKRKIVFSREISVNEYQFQQLCANAVHLKMCFNIINTNYRQIKCPYLHYIEPCERGKQVFTIIQNPLLTDVDIRVNVVYSKTEKIMIVRKNQRLIQQVIDKLKGICPICDIEGYFSKCSGLGPITNINAFLEQCSGQPFIEGAPGIVLEADLSSLTEEQLNRLFSETVEMKICIVISNSQIKRLVFPKLTKWIPCAPGRASLTLKNNFELELVEFPLCQQGCLNNVIIQNNPRLPKPIIDSLSNWCTQCVVQYYTPSCGLGVGGFTALDFVIACAGQQYIKPEGVVVRIKSSQVTEAQMNAFCSKAVYMEVCIEIFDSDYRSIRCPYLREVRPCEPGGQVFTIVRNRLLSVVDIPVDIWYPKIEKILIVKKNKELTVQVIEKLKRICPHCDIEGFFSKCSALGPIADVNAFVEQCSGEPFIFGAPGIVLEADLSSLTEEQLNRLFAETVEMKICIVIKNSQIKRLVFPKLTQWTPCAPGRASLTLKNNFELEIVEFPSCQQGCLNNVIIQNNPRLPKPIIDSLSNWCTQCVVQYYTPSCGLGVGGFTALDFVIACAGQQYIKPEGVVVRIKSSQVTEAQMNAFCSKAVYMEVCIEIFDSDYRSIRCPYLREVRPCEPGGQVFTIVRNRLLSVVDIPVDIWYPKLEKILIVKKNKELTVQVIEKLKRICPHCDIEGFFSKCSGLGPIMDVNAFVEQCSGEPFIDGAPGIILEADLSSLTEEQLNRLFAETVEMKICIVIKGSKLKRLAFPKLKLWEPCAMNKPALTLSNNFHLEIMEFPSCQQGCLRNVIARYNPRLPNTVLDLISRWCIGCILEYYAPSCGLGNGGFSAIDFVMACAGKPFIKPEGVVLWINSNEVPEDAMNAFCSNAVYMEVCIVISESNYRSIRCPRLEEIRPCQPGKQVFTIVDNPLLSIVEIPINVSYPSNEKVLLVKKNKKLMQPSIQKLKQICPACDIEGYLSIKAAFDEIFNVEFSTAFDRGSHPLANAQYRNEKLFLGITKNGDLVAIGSTGKLVRFSSSDVPKLSISFLAWNYFRALITNMNLRQHKTAGCSGLGPITDLNIFVEQCSGQPFIEGAEGVVLEVDLSVLTEEQLNRLFAETVEMKICIVIKGSQIKRLSFPKLKRWTPCAYGKPALTLTNNYKLEYLEFPSCQQDCLSNIIVQHNPRLPKSVLELISRWCSRCMVEYYVPSCGLGVGGFTALDFVRACAGKPYIKAEGVVMWINSSQVTEAEMNAFCSNAVYMEVCIVISHSNYASFRCPHLREIMPCEPGKPTFTFINNLHLRVVEIPVTLIFPSDERPFVIRGNPKIPQTWIIEMQKLCPRCQIEVATGCGLAETEYTDKQIVQACAGKTVIRAAEGFYLTLSSQYVTEGELNAFCSKAIYMEICMTITQSSVRALRCPHLEELVPCLPGKPAITIVDNPFFEDFEIPVNVVYPVGTPIVVIKRNPMLNPSLIKKFKPWCPHCEISMDYVCGITKPSFTMKEVVVACAGKTYIKPAPGVIVIVTSDEVTEQELNLLCSKAVYMEICIEITNSQFTSLRCPYLKELRPCQPDRPAIKIVNNRRFYELLIPITAKYPPGAPIVEIQKNPMLNSTTLNPLKEWCKNCIITLDYACGLNTNNFNLKDLVASCAGYETIVPPPGVTLVITSESVTEEEMNRMFAKVVYMEACIVIKDSNFKSLRLPYLQELKSCEPGRPAIDIEYNPFFEEFDIPVNVKYQLGAKIVVVRRNPSLRLPTINRLQRWCPQCTIHVDYVCGLTIPSFTVQQAVTACAGEKYIVASPSAVIVLKAQSIPEDQMNALCSKAVIMNVCIEIMNSNYRSLRCPHLKEIRPCQLNLPAIRIINNNFFTDVLIPETATYPSGVQIIEITGNPLINVEYLSKIKLWCPHCNVVGEYACGLNKRNPSVRELMATCPGHVVIVPVPGDELVLHSKDFTEAEFNAFCSRIVYMEACITIEMSKFRSLRCPQLRYMKACRQGEKALRIVQNFFLEVIELSPHFNVTDIEFRDNPRVPYEFILYLKKLCPGCSISITTDCGLTRPFTMKQLIAACANNVIITPSSGYIIDIYSKDLTEVEMNMLCSKAAYMEICITIAESNYKKFECPALQVLRPCTPNRPAIRIVDNPYLVHFSIPTSISYPEGTIILEIGGNPALALELVEMYMKVYQNAVRIISSNTCMLEARGYMNKELVLACAGKAKIRPREGYYLIITSDQVTESELNALCSKAEHMEICITITNSQYRSLRCPYLKYLKSCRPDQPALKIVDNLYFGTLQIPTEIKVEEELVFEVSGNPLLPEEIIRFLISKCPGCHITADYDCGLQRPFTMKQVATTCANKKIIRPRPGYILEFHSDQLTEKELNALCSNVIYLEACVVISGSKIQSFRCPNLKILKPCQLGRPAITILNNPLLAIFEIPIDVIYPDGQLVIEISGNPLLPAMILQRYKKLCPGCMIVSDECVLEDRPYSDKELVQACAGKSIIRPTSGYILTISSQYVTEEEMNALCSKATYMEICIVIIDSNYKSLRCPKLKELKPCQPGRPAIKIVRNLQFSILVIPTTVVYPKGEHIIEISENPRLDITIVKQLLVWCSQCHITANLACDLEKRTYTDHELVAACAGKTIIKPAEGYMLVLSSDKVTEAEMNALCSKAIYMEICITIVDSHFTSLQCPYLRELRPCQPGRPAIKIVRNLQFSILVIPTNVVYPKGEHIIEISENPRLDITIVKQLLVWCPQCRVTANLACDLEKRTYTDHELVIACAGKTIIKPAEGYMLVISSDKVTETEMNALCSKAIYMEICIEIIQSQFTQLRCPHLRELRPCQPGRPAIKIVNNLLFEILEIPSEIVIPKNEPIFEISEVPRMQIAIIKRLQQMCRDCKITANQGCGLNKRTYSDAEMVAACAGKRIIKPAEGFMLVMSSDTVTEAEMNAICSEAVYMEICIIIQNSQFRSLNCPHLRELKPCRPGVPAIRIIGNPHLTHVSMSKTLLYQIGTGIYEVRGNPNLSTESINALRRLCPECTVRRSP